ncbi:MAG TPA: TonB family protein, partial [Clostridia bacterium]|nr:TonB family protein [Clostridia bacterium]
LPAAAPIEKPQPLPPPPEQKPLPPPPEPKQDPAPEPVKPEPVKPEPVKETAKPEKRVDPDEPSIEPSKERKPRKIEVNTKMVVRKRDTKADAKAQAEARAEAQAKEEARQWAAKQKRLAQEFNRLAQNIGEDMSGETTVELKGPGGGGVPYANFLQAVKSVYARAWIVPDGVTDDDATAVASVTIARDGMVISGRVTRSSGNPLVDRSVQATLDRVKYAAPLPDNARENQRTVNINFNVKAKRGLG